MSWEVFISYASEEKDKVAIPLALRLRKAGIRVWIDEFEMNIGDRLHRKMDEGIAKSDYGIVILSTHFLASTSLDTSWMEWPRKRLMEKN